MQLGSLQYPHSPMKGASESRSRCLAWLPPGAPGVLRHSAVVASANSISITRFSCGGASSRSADAHPLSLPNGFYST